MPTFAVDQLMSIADRLLQAIGATPDEAHIVADHLVTSNLAGHDSHGMIRIPQYHADAKAGKLALKQGVTIEKETSTTALVNGNWTWGPVIASKAMDLAIAKAKQHGNAVVGVKQCFHVGRVGVYPLKAAREGLIAKVWCNGHGIVRVAPWGGSEARFGTNPIAIAIPTGGDPVLVDITTSVVAEGKVRLAKNKQVAIPDGWVLDKAGNPTTNPADLYEGGTLLPMGGPVGHKGYGLSMVVDLLGGAVTGDGCGAMPGVRVGNGLFIEVFDPTAFLSRAEYRSNVDAFIAYVKSSKPRPGASIMLPGEPELRLEKERRAQGIAIDDGTWSQVQQVANELNVTL